MDASNKLDADERKRKVAEAISGPIVAALDDVIEAVEGVTPRGELRDGLFAQLGKGYSAALHAGRCGKSASAELKAQLDELAAFWLPKAPPAIKRRAFRRYDTAVRATTKFSFTAVDPITREPCEKTVPRGRPAAVPAVVAERALRAGAAELLPQPALSDRIRIAVLQTHRVDDERVLGRGGKLFLETSLAEQLISKGIVQHLPELLKQELAQHDRDLIQPFAERAIDLGDVDDETWSPPAPPAPRQASTRRLDLAMFAD
jgi:hypothetical protein